MQKKQTYLLVGLLLCAVAVVAAFAMRGPNLIQDLRAIMDATVAQLRAAGPLVLFLAMVFLPLVGFPISPLWLAAGAAFGAQWGFGLATAGLLVNIALAYVIANRWLREFLLKLMAKKGYCLPAATSGDLLRLTLALRITPGIPSFVQSYLLGLANVPFLPYYLISVPVQVAYAAAFTLFGGSIFQMKGGGIIAGACLLVALILIVKVVRHYFDASLYVLKKSDVNNAPVSSQG